MNDPLVVEMSFSVSSSLVYIALTDVERWISGARSALSFCIAMSSDIKKQGCIEPRSEVAETLGVNTQS